MSLLNFRALGVLLALSGLPAVTGCAEEPPAEEQTMGTFSAALSAVGSDGAHYQFETGTYLGFSNTSWGEAYFIDGPEALYEKQLPVGSYQLTIYPPDDSLNLIRTVDGVSESVPTTWDDPQPFTFNIVDGAVTSVELHFVVQGLADVTFATGDVEISMEVVHEEVSSSGLFTESGTVTLNTDFYQDPFAQYATELGGVVGNNYDQALWLASAGEWSQLTSAGVCKDVTVAAYGPTSGPVSRRFAQIAPATGRLCIFDYGTQDYYSVSVWHSGEAPIEQQSFLPGSDNFFQLNLGGYIPDVFDGQTLQQSVLASETPVSTGWFEHWIHQGGVQIARFEGQLNGGTIQLSP